MHLDTFGYSLAVEYIFLALGPIKQLLLASKSVPYYTKLSLSTPLYGIDQLGDPQYSPQSLSSVSSLEQEHLLLYMKFI